MLVVDKLSKSFRDGKPILNDLNFEIPDGQMVGIIGRSGAGKSTLLQLANRTIEPTSGRILCNGADVTALKGKHLRQWRCECAMIFQQFNIVGRLDVLTNVLLGRLRKRNTMKSLLKWFSKEERYMAMTMLEQLDLVPQALQRAETLSGGQQQRVAIARALLQEPRVILADEPVSSLDPHNSSVVMDYLSEIHRSRGITILCNLHSIEIAVRHCQRIIALAEGRIVFDGSPSGLDSGQVRDIYKGKPQRSVSMAQEY